VRSFSGRHSHWQIDSVELPSSEPTPPSDPLCEDHGKDQALTPEEVMTVYVGGPLSLAPGLPLAIPFLNTGTFFPEEHLRLTDLPGMERRMSYYSR
jgi:hypothetical protein